MVQTKYITIDEFKEYFPEVDLIAELGEASAYALLVRTENRLSAFLNTQFYRNVDREYPKFTDYQKLHYKIALLEQVFWTFHNGDNSVDSGFDPERGVIATESALQTKLISRNAINELILCGLWCRKIRNRRAVFNNWL